VKSFVMIVVLPIIVGSVFLQIGLIGYKIVQEIQVMRLRVERKNRIARR